MDKLLAKLNEINAVSQAKCDYLKTLALLQSLKAGDVTIDQVDLTGDGWTVSNTPAEPAADDVSE